MCSNQSKFIRWIAIIYTLDKDIRSLNNRHKGYRNSPPRISSRFSGLELVLKLWRGVGGGVELRSRPNFFALPFLDFLHLPQACVICLAFVVLAYPRCVSKYETMCEKAGPILERTKNDSMDSMERRILTARRRNNWL